MLHFKLKFRHKSFVSWALPRPTEGELQCSPRLPSWIKGEREGMEGKKRRIKGGEGSTK